MEVQKIKLSELVPFEDNPRHISDTAIDAVARSIKEHGFNQPLVVEKDSNRICVGHTRYLAAKELKLETVPCYVKEFESEEHFLSYNVADNKTSEFSQWDTEDLAYVLRDINNSANKDAYTGFSAVDVSKILLANEDKSDTDVKEDMEEGTSTAERWDKDASEGAPKSVQLFFSEKDFKEFEKLADEVMEKEPALLTKSDAVLFALKNFR